MLHDQTGLILFLLVIAALLYKGYDYWRLKSKKQDRQMNVVTKTEEAKAEAKREHEELKKKGPEAVSDDTDRMLGL